MSMYKHWQLQEAKNRLSHVVKQAVDDGPQVISVHNDPTVVILSLEEYHRLTGPKTKLTEFFRNSPLNEIELDIERSDDLSREIKL